MVPRELAISQVKRDMADGYICCVFHILLASAPQFNLGNISSQAKGPSGLNHLMVKSSVVVWQVHAVGLMDA